jgi:uncharacterized membrane protein YidH (DUF202 family)
MLDISTRPGLNRDRGAYDRALLAWIKTSTSLVFLGFLSETNPAPTTVAVRIRAVQSAVLKAIKGAE